MPTMDTALVLPRDGGGWAIRIGERTCGNFADAARAAEIAEMNGYRVVVANETINEKE